MPILDYALYRYRMNVLVRLLFWLGAGHRGKVFAACCAFVGLGAVLSAGVPYEPYEPVALKIVPDAACDGKEISIESTRVWRETWYQSIGEVDVSAQWRDVETGALYPALSDAPTRPNLDKPTGTVVTDYRIPTPRDAGEYELLLQYEVSGRVLAAPRNQDVPPDPEDWLVSVNTLRVESCQ